MGLKPTRRFEKLDYRIYLNNQILFFTQVLRPCSLVMENMIHVSKWQTVVVTVEELTVKVRLLLKLLLVISWQKKRLIEILKILESLLPVSCKFMKQAFPLLPPPLFFSSGRLICRSTQSACKFKTANIISSMIYNVKYLILNR